MNKQQGFSVIELVMVMAISAIMMTILLQIYNQVTRNMLRVERFVFEDTQVLTLKNRLSKDFAGLSAVWFTQAELQEKQAAIDPVKNPPSKEKKKSSKYFYSVNKDGHLDTLTFITTNALQSYGTSKNRFVRIVYRVEKDPVNKDLLRLMRKEIAMPTENIDEESLKQGKFYELVSGVKSLEMTYQLIDKVALQQQEFSEKTKAESSDSLQKKEDKKPIIRPVTQWVEAEDKKKSKKKEQGFSDDTPQEDDQNENNASAETLVKKEDLGGAMVPKFIKMNIVFGATYKQLEKKYMLEFCIPSSLDNAPNWIKIQPVSVSPDTITERQ